MEDPKGSRPYLTGQSTGSKQQPSPKAADEKGVLELAASEAPSEGLLGLTLLKHRTHRTHSGFLVVDSRPITASWFCVGLSMLLPVFMPQLPHLGNGDDNHTSLLGRVSQIK